MAYHSDHCHCRDYTRSQLLGSAAAQAGKGLPSIEAGMPDPAGTGLSRRTFVFRSVGLALSVYGATKLPFEAFEEGIAHAASAPKTLVSIFFDGGIDSLNTMAPLNNSLYQSKRPNLKLTSAAYPGSDPTSFRIGADTGNNTTLYWHPSATGFRDLFNADKMTVFPAIGYDSPDQSHFTSRHYYETGKANLIGNVQTGWLGRYVDAYGTADNPLQGLSLAYDLSPSLATLQNPVAAVSSVTNYDLPNPLWGGTPETKMYESFKNLGNLGGADSAGMTTTRRVIKQTEQVREQLEPFGATLGTPAAALTMYNAVGNTELVRQLKSLAALLADPSFSISAVTMSATGGYDTHSDEAGTLATNLSRTSRAVAAFQKDLELRNLEDKVMINMWSEFGRRPDENGSGTDHGAAGLGFLVGKHAKQGFVGEFPGLASLDEDDNLLHTSDFRRLYASLLQDWLGVDAGPIIPDNFGSNPYDASLLFD